MEGAFISKQSFLNNLLVIIIIVIGLSSCSKVAPPDAIKIKKVLTEFGNDRIDSYYWMKERENPKVRSYLEAENRYANNVLAHTTELQENIYQELIARIDPDETKAPYFENGYFYYSRYEESKEYPIYCRKKDTLDAPEEILLNVNELAAGYSFYNVTGLRVSRNNNILAFGTDTLGRRKYIIKFKNLKTGKIYPDELKITTGTAVWANDNKTLFYTIKDHTLRSYKIMRHKLGTDYQSDVEVYHEKDLTFSVSVSKTKSNRYIMISSHSTLSSEIRFLKADKPDGQFRIIQKRQPDIEYHAEHFKDKFIIRTNFQAKNFRLVTAPAKRSGLENWQDIVAHRDHVLLEDYEIFDKYLVVDERENGLSQLRIIPWDETPGYLIDFDQAAYTVSIDKNRELNTDILRFRFSSLATPNTIYDYDMSKKVKTLVKQDKILGGFKSADYSTERLMIPANDGTKVPVSLVYRKDLNRKNPNPLYLLGYGSYGSSYEPRFRTSIISLLDRGFIFAIGHIRGGQEMGRHWYEDGKLLRKKNTFTDFVNCAEYLLTNGYTASDILAIRGGSAGGLLIGAVVNMAGSKFRVAIADVPFVDVVTTMLDPGIPLTTSEYDEWGDPNTKEYYEYILSYSPYDNVVQQKYPALLVTTSFHDSQVQYWEPAKWVAKLRDLKTDDNLLILKTDFDSGHGGASGRYKKHKMTAFQYAFILDQMGIK